jgi:branched-chain amino acid transport system ATP-binding protein
MLEVSKLRAGYGAINVLWDLSLRADEGKLTTIVGPNGAGKSTLLKAIMGLVPATQGDIALQGQSIARSKTWDMAEKGLVLVPEGRLVFRDMSVEENLVMGAFPKSKRPALTRNIERAFALFPKLKERRKQLAGSLSGGEAQMVAMARGLMAEPRVLLIDEPSLGLAPVIVQEIFQILRRLKEEGVTIVLVEQNTHMALSVADRVYMMRSGKVVLDKAATEVDVEKLHDLYFALEA